MRSLTMVFITLFLLSGTALATTAEQDSPAAEAAWKEALAERDPIRRRKADFNAIQQRTYANQTISPIAPPARISVRGLENGLGLLHQFRRGDKGRS